jgi:poly(3-hydroxybutyrate) depolymerase
MGVNTDMVATIGVSSGAFMSNNLHVIHSSTVKGMGSIAGGVYDCIRQSDTLHVVTEYDETYKRVIESAESYESTN